MTMQRPGMAAALRDLALAIRWVKTIAAFKQKSAIPDDDPAAAGYMPLPHKKQRGRPPSQSTLKMQAFKASRPPYAKRLDPGQSELLKALRSYWQVLRENQGLQSKTVSDAFALEVIAIDEEQFEALISGRSLSRKRQAHRVEIIKKLEAVKKRISESASVAGATPRHETGKDRLNQVAPDLLGKLADGSLRYKVADRRLQNLKEELKIDAVPTERTLRRWVQEEKSDKHAQKK